MASSSARKVLTVEPLGHGSLGGLMEGGRIWSTAGSGATPSTYDDAQKVVGPGACKVLQNTGRVACRDPATNTVVRVFGAGDVLDVQNFTKNVDHQPRLSLQARADGVDVCDDRVHDGGLRARKGYATVRDFESVLPSDAEMRFATGHANGVVRVYNGDMRRAACVTPVMGTLRAFNGRYAAAIDDAGRLALYEWATRALVRDIGTGGYEGAALTPAALVAWRDRTVTCWRLDAADLRGPGKSAMTARRIHDVVTDREVCRSQGDGGDFLVILEDLSAEPFRAQ